MMLNLKQINSIFVCFSFGAYIGSALLAQPTNQLPAQNYQQPVQQAPVYQTQPTPTYQQQYPNQIINGQPVQGQIINGQIINGQVIGQPVYGQPVQNGVTIGSNGQPLTQGQVQPTPATKQPYVLSKEDQEKIAALTEKVGVQTERVEFLVKENVRLSGLVESSEEIRLESDKLRQEVQRLGGDLEAANSALDEMRTKPAVVPEGMSAQQEEALNRVNLRLQQATQENTDLKSRIQQLDQQSAGLQTELTNLRAAGSNMANLQSDLATATTRIDELGQQNQTLLEEKERLNDLYQTVSDENENYNQQITMLSSKNQEFESALSLAKTKSLDSTKATVSKVATKAKASSSLASSQNGKVADLMGKNEKLQALNEKVTTENTLLSRKLSTLEGTVGELTTAKNNLVASNSQLEVNVPGLGEASGGGKFSITRWIIPFLLLGLGVALYVFLTEEGGGAGVRTIADGGREFNSDKRNFKRENRDTKNSGDDEKGRRRNR